MGESWEGFEISGEQHEFLKDRTQARAWLMKYTALLLAFLILIILVVSAMLMEDKEHLDTAWKLAVFLIPASLGLRYRT